MGQPELVERLRKPELRQLNQRISARGILNSLNNEESLKYVECRLRARGGAGAEIFEPGALEGLLQHSDGIPRKINVLCHNAMLLAYSTGAKKVSLKTAKKTATEYDDSPRITNQTSSAPHPQKKPALIAGAALASLLLLGFVYLHVSSDQAIKQTVSSGQAMEQTVRPVQTVKQPGIEGRADPAAMPPAAAPLARTRLESRASLEAENLVLRQQVIVLSGKSPSRVRLRNIDRLIFVWLYRFFPSILNATHRGQARNRYPVASARLSRLLALEIPPRWWPPEDRRRDSRPHPTG